MPLITTAGDLVAFALRASTINGVGQTPSAMDSNDGLQLLVDMLAEWKSKRGLVWVIDDTSLLSTGQSAYTIGDGGDFDVARPDNLAYARANFANTSGAGTLGYPLDIITAAEDWNRIALKQLSTIPAAVFYQSNYPLGFLHFWPNPPNGEYSLHVGAKTPLPVYTGLTDALNVPPLYQRAMRLGLIIEMQMSYGIDVNPATVGALRAALNVLRLANTQIPELHVPTFRGRGYGGVSANASPGFQSGGMV